jgi:hypothetical protein
VETANISRDEKSATMDHIRYLTLVPFDTENECSMPPADKAKAAGVSVTSFFDLKAELAKKSDEFARTKAAGGPKYVPGEGRTRPDKVCTPYFTVP